MTDTKHNTPWPTVRVTKPKEQEFCVVLQQGYLFLGRANVKQTQNPYWNTILLDMPESHEPMVDEDCWVSADEACRRIEQHAPLVEALERELKTCYACNGKPMYQGYADNCEACRESRKVLANAKGATDE